MVGLFVNILLICMSAKLVAMDTEKSLRLLGLLPSTGSGWTGGQACLAPIHMALEDIKTHKDILQGYNLTYTWIDTQCDPGVAVYRMVQEFYNSPPNIMVLGDGCSPASEATAQISYLWNVTQLSYGSSSPILSDRKRFPKFFRLAGPDQMLNPARIALMDHYNWKKVATINQALEFFSVVIDDFVVRTHDTPISIVSQEIFARNPLTHIDNLKRHDARIIMTAMYEDKARSVLCSAYKVGLYGPKIVWVLYGWYSSTFWKIDLQDVDCTEDQMDAAIEGAILTSFFSRNPVEERGIANMTANEFDERLVNHPEYNPDHAGFDRVAGKCYDHIWMTALALDCADKKLKAIGHPKTLDEFTYEDGDMNEIIFECVSEVSLTGVTGKFTFETGADPNNNVKIEQIQGGERKLVGQYRMDTTPHRFEWFGKGIVWKDGNVPRDSTYVILQEVTIPWSVYIPLATCSAIGISLAIALFVFNVIHKSNPTVKMSSPNINNVLLLGCILCYTTVFIKPTETNNSVVCKARDFCFALGFTVTFGSLFSKTWRVYRIFTNKKLLRMKIKDYQLLAIICGVSVVVLSVLIVREIVNPRVMVEKSLDKEVYELGNDAEVRPFVRMCQSENASYFSWVLYVMEGALLSFGAFLAWETRNVKIEALNDSHQIGLCLYNVVVLSAVGLTLTLLLDQQIIILYGMTSGCLIIGTTVIQVVVFVPKVLAVYKRTSSVGDIHNHSSGSGALGRVNKAFSSGSQMPTPTTECIQMP